MTTRHYASLACVTLAGSSAFAAEGGGGGGLLSPNPGTLFWTAVTFTALLLLMRVVAWRPLLGAIEARERSIEGNIREAEERNAEAAKLLDEHKSLVSRVHRERAELIDKGQQEAERLKAEILEEARRQKEQILQQTQEQVDSGLRQARTELRSEAVALAISAAERLLQRNVDDATQRKLVEDHLAELEAKSGA